MLTLSQLLVLQVSIKYFLLRVNVPFQLLPIILHRIAIQKLFELIYMVFSELDQCPIDSVANMRFKRFYQLVGNLLHLSVELECFNIFVNFVVFASVGANRN